MRAAKKWGRKGDGNGTSIFLLETGWVFLLYIFSYISDSRILLELLYVNAGLAGRKVGFALSGVTAGAGLFLPEGKSWQKSIPFQN
jgi:hypothetical protein